MDTVRVLRIVEYTGDRKTVERMIENSIHGTKEIRPFNGGVCIIRASTIGSYPEILEEAPDGSKKV